MYTYVYIYIYIQYASVVGLSLYMLVLGALQLVLFGLERCYVCSSGGSPSHLWWYTAN